MDAAPFPMSLRFFHVVFIVASVALALGLALWSLRAVEAGAGTLYAVMGLGSFAAAVGLVFYGAWFLRKTGGGER